MSWWRVVYTGLLYVLIPFALLRLMWRARRQRGYLHYVGERFGHYRLRSDRPVIWLHAVSVGETRAAEPLVKALHKRWPEHQILLTHMTPTGRETSEQVFADRVLRCYLPYDLPAAVERFLSHFRPYFGALLETELWPNLIHACHVRSLPLFLVNARLSERSASGYARVGPFARETLQRLTAVAAQTQADADRLSALGARNPVACGNLKFDRSPRQQDLELAAHFRALYGERPVFLAASTRDGEEVLVLDAIAQTAHPGLLSVIVPRHPQRFEGVARLLAERDLSFQRRSDGKPVSPGTQVLLGDSMGELFAYYAACDVAFVGGSLLPLGGQNLLEASAAGKPVFVGPHMFNFEEATRLALESGAALQVRDKTELAAALARLLSDEPTCRRMGEAGLELMRAHQGATQRIVTLIDRNVAGYPWVSPDIS